VKTKYYKVLKQHTVTFNANGGAYSGGATTRTALVPHTMTVTAPAATDNPTRTGYTFGTWYKEAACTTQWNFATDTVTGDITLYAQWNPASGTGYKVEHYQEKTDGTYPSTPTDIESRTGQTDHTFTAAEIKGMKKTTYQGFEFDKQELNHPSIKADGTTIIKLFYKRKQITVTFKLDGGKISGDPSDVTRAGKYGAPLAKPADPTKPGYTFSDWQPTPPAPALSSTFPAANAEYTAKWTANTYTVRFNVYGGTHGTLKANPEGGTEKTTSTTDTVSVEHGKKVTFTAQPDEGYEVDSWTGATADTPNTTATLLNVTTDNINVTVKFKKKVYTVTFSVAAGEGSLIGEGGGLINTADGSTPVSLTIQHGKKVEFTATPKSGGVWKVAGWMKNNAEVNGTNDTYTLSNVTENTTVKVKFYQPEIAGTAGSTTAWRDLLSAVRNAPANATITINGEINATPNYGNNGEIVINKNLTIKGKKTDGSDTLNAALQSRIFKVETGSKLTLENITLRSGGKYPATEDGGGIYSEGTLMLNNTTIESCGAKNGGGIYAQGGAEITLTNTEINGCVANENGGGLYIKDSRLTLDNATIGGEQLYSDTQAGKTKGNKAKNGGGIFLTGSGTAGSRMTGGKVSYNLATDGTYAKGGGIYIQESASFTMQSGNINSNEVKTGTVEDGGGVYVRGQGSGSGTHASFTLNGGTIGDNYAGFGGGVMVTAGGSCTMKDGTISRNRANYGGGVCAKKEDSADGVFTMKNGTITGNRAYKDGGAAEVHGIFTWEGGDITGNHVNTAPRGQIIHRDGGHFNNNCHGTVS
ncbi:MAG: InlB B-repeat-containing protein, partial [Treponema sp.]